MQLYSYAFRARFFMVHVENYIIAVKIYCLNVWKKLYAHASNVVFVSFFNLEIYSLNVCRIHHHAPQIIFLFFFVAFFLLDRLASSHLLPFTNKTTKLSYETQVFVLSFLASIAFRMILFNCLSTIIVILC